jgi:hypothetical protein
LKGEGPSQTQHNTPAGELAPGAAPIGRDGGRERKREREREREIVQTGSVATAGVARRRGGERERERAQAIISSIALRSHARPSRTGTQHTRTRPSRAMRRSAHARAAEAPLIYFSSPGTPAQWNAARHRRRARATPQHSARCTATEGDETASGLARSRVWQGFPQSTPALRVTDLAAGTTRHSNTQSPCTAIQPHHRNLHRRRCRRSCTRRGWRPQWAAYTR